MNRASPAEAPSERRPTILVVEDEIFVRLLVTEELRDQGYTVLEASSADEALSLLRGDMEVGLVFTDVRMPGTIDGVELARHVRARYPEIKIMITSGHLIGLPVGEFVDEFFAKPYDLQGVIQKIADLLEADRRLQK